MKSREMRQSGPGERIPYIDEFKFILILGVVMGHCNFASDYPARVVDDTPWLSVIGDMSNATLSGVCVPCFFIISGILFFHNAWRFTIRVYVEKLRKRMRTLLVPYIFWCAVCCLLLFLKHRYLDFPGLGIFLDNGRVDWWNFFKGFFSISEMGGHPYAFAFWFIRNLMIFSILSPIVYLLGRYTWATIVAVIIHCAGLCPYGFIWFVVGAYMGIHSVGLTLGKRNYCIAGMLYVLCTLLILNHIDNLTVRFLHVICAFFLLYFCAMNFKSRFVGATFMIYATHQCYCTFVRKFFERLTEGCSDMIPVAYVSLFLTLVALGILANFLVNRYLKPIRPLLTGNR